MLSALKHNYPAHENMHAMFKQSNTHSAMHSETTRRVQWQCICISTLPCSHRSALQHVVCQLVQQGLQLELGYVLSPSYTVQADVPTSEGQMQMHNAPFR